MTSTNRPRYLDKRINNTVLALKAARLSQGLTQRQAAKRCNCSRSAFEQLENGRCNFTLERIHKIVRGMGFPINEFETLVKEPHKALSVVSLSIDNTLARKPRRNQYKVINKDVRIIRILRLRKGISQRKASKLCGLSKSAFSHIENGRTNLEKDRINEILKCLGYSWESYEELSNASVLRDEILREATKLLEKLDDHVLNSTVQLIKSLQK